MAILDWEVRKLRSKEVISVKVSRWNKNIKEVTWEDRGNDEVVPPSIYNLRWVTSKNFLVILLQYFNQILNDLEV